MRKLLVLVFISVLIFGCKKDIKENPPTSGEYEVAFQVDLLDPGSTKDWECKVDALGNLLEPDYAEVTIGGTTYYPLVYRIDGILYTQNIKLMLPPGQSTQTLMITKFVLWDDGGTPTPIPDPMPAGDDEIVMGTPDIGSDYEIYIGEAYRFEYEITVEAFKKFEYAIEVLCFQDDSYLLFGFDWFVITEIVIREQCFFGDICIKHLEDYEGSWYWEFQEPVGAVQLDMPALMKLHVYGPGGSEVPYSPFTNANSESNWGVGAPLCIQYPDNLQITGETFTADLYIYVKIGGATTGFDWLYFDTYTWVDDGKVPEGDDGIVDIVLGTCNLMSADFEYVYQNLPATVDMYCQGAPWGPGDFGTYFDITLAGIVGSYDICNCEYGVFCGDQQDLIYLNNWYYGTEVYGSIYPGTFPAGMEQQFKDNIDLANWLFNNLENYPGYLWGELQDALWILLDYNYVATELINNPPTATTNDMVADAIAYGDGYLPPPGGWAAIIFWNGTQIQMIFIFVDP